MTPANSMTDALIGRRLANFKIEHLLGQGGMAKVYYGIDVKLKRPVAIKVLDERLRSNQAYAQRFVREAQTVATWRNENVLQVYYADEAMGLYYFVTEYIDGADLGKLLDEYTRLGELIPHKDVLRIGHAIASALDYAHRQGVIHRDVKPANVFVERSGRVVLGDFGLALEVDQGTLGEVLGTPHYISPEQARRSAEAVPASDLYSLGVILYEMLTGVVPFDDPSPTTVAIQHITLLPPPPREINPDLNEETEAVLLKALSKKPPARYQSGKELMNALEKALSLPQSQPEKPAALPSPAGMANQRPSQSRLTVLDIIAARTPQTAELLPPKSSALPAFATASLAGFRDKLKLPYVLGGCALLFIMGLVSALGLLLGIFNPARRGSALPRSSETAFVATGLAATALGTQVQPALAAASPTSGIHTTATNSPAALPGLPAATNTSSPIAAQISPTANAAAAPTVKYPQGRHFRLFYNENGFYIYSLADEKVAIEPIAFERLKVSGAPTNRFEGIEWAKMYAYIWPENCLKAEIRDSRSYLAPSVCLGYNATRSYKRDEAVVFWTVRDGTTQFRVLWGEEEIARCEIAAGECEVFLP